MRRCHKKLFFPLEDRPIRRQIWDVMTNQKRGSCRAVSQHLALIVCFLFAGRGWRHISQWWVCNLWLECQYCLFLHSLMSSSHKNGWLSQIDSLNVEFDTRKKTIPVPSPNEISFHLEALRIVSGRNLETSSVRIETLKSSNNNESKTKLCINPYFLVFPILYFVLYPGLEMKQFR